MDPALPLDTLPPRAAPPRPGPALPALAGLGLGFAAALFVISSLVWWTVGADPLVTAPAKLIGIAGDAALAALLTAVLWALRRLALGWKALIGAVLALALAPVSGLIDWGLHIWFVYPQPVFFDPEYFAQVVIYTTAELFGWACLYLALDYAQQTRATERRLAEMRAEAIGAQMRALQYQVNPHFLFNTLNAIAGLIEEGASGPACRMVENLAAYLRRTLLLDPLTDVTLRDEIELQLEYLHIEEARFAGRLVLDVQIEPALADLRLPPLILQPLVENAIKHGISRVPGRSVLTIRAEARPGGMLALCVENAMPAQADASAEGMGIGLANVQSRLAARWPGRATLSVAPSAPGQMRAEMLLPVLA